ncbi:MAG: glycosyltransferase [Candidatus Levybacteria bacterium]|nr:glycosyltransferase [Candidatus Levybacteria bacterium]
MTLPLSIIIPTYNEETYLPKLLRSIRKQTCQPYEIIVADAKSQDKTRKIAREFGCKVIEGGKIAKARNNGARLASQELLLFLDADVILPNNFLCTTSNEIKKFNLDIASCYSKPLSSFWIDKIIFFFLNLYLKVISKWRFSTPGYCIFIKKVLHNKINGFDESIVLGEDMEYSRRAMRYGRYGMLYSQKIPVSVRRFEENGRMKSAFDQIRMSIYIAILGSIRDERLFKYPFGNHK